jgi:hypothetical protein
VKTGLAEGQKSHRGYYQWVKDFKLVEWGPQGLFPEYLEMGMVNKWILVSSMVFCSSVNCSMCAFVVGSGFPAVHFQSRQKLLISLNISHIFLSLFAMKNIAKIQY